MREPKISRKPDLPIINLLPNLMTILAICAGLTAIRHGVMGDFHKAVALILVAGVLDGLDGRFARLLNSQSAMGAELDSLADFLNFGCAPPIIIYLWALQDTGSTGWIAVLIFAICCVTRLARFNVSAKSDQVGEPPAFFIGIPSPSGAILVMLPLFVAFLTDDVLILPDPLLGGYIVGVGLLMISKLPTPSFKGLRVAREKARYFLVGAVLIVGALVVYPWATLVTGTLIYALNLIWVWRRWIPGFRRKRS